MDAAPTSLGPYFIPRRRHHFLAPFGQRRRPWLARQEKVQTTTLPSLVQEELPLHSHICRSRTGEGGHRQGQTEEEPFG